MNTTYFHVTSGKNTLRIVAVRHIGKRPSKLAEELADTQYRLEDIYPDCTITCYTEPSAASAPSAFNKAI